MAASGLPTNPGTRANWLGDIRPGCSYRGTKTLDLVNQQVHLLLSTEKLILFPSISLFEIIMGEKEAVVIEQRGKKKVSSSELQESKRALYGLSY